MLETDTIVFTILFCVVAASFPFLRAMIRRNNAMVREYLDKVDSEQERIPVDEANWYYRTLRRRHIETRQELNDFLVRSRQIAGTIDPGMKIVCYICLYGGLIVYAVFTFFLILQPDETKVNIVLLLGASSCIIAYLLIKALLDNSKVFNTAIEDYFRNNS